MYNKIISYVYQEMQKNKQTHYHTFAHIEQTLEFAHFMFSQPDLWEVNIEKIVLNFPHLSKLHDQIIYIPTSAFIALLFHDIIYCPGASDNEHKSALALKYALTDSDFLNSHDMGHIKPEDIQFAIVIINATKHHVLPDNLNSEQELICKACLDADMSILSSPWPDFEIYCEQIEKEFVDNIENLTTEVFQIERIKFFKKLLKKQIFHFDFMAHYERQARANIEEYIEQSKINDIFDSLKK